MNTKLIIWILGIFLAVIVVGVVWYVLFAPKSVTQQTTQPTTTLPISGSVTSVSSLPSSTTASQAARTLSIKMQNGSAVTVNDFIHNGVTISDKANTGHYLLAGNLGYCLSNPRQCQASSATNFTVYYNSAQQSFTIELTKEPIGQARLAMQQFMLKTLGITEQQMCNLNYLVGVTEYVNPLFAGKNLGFSFCPGATELP